MYKQLLILCFTFSAFFGSTNLHSDEYVNVGLAYNAPAKPHKHADVEYLRSRFVTFLKAHTSVMGALSKISKDLSEGKKIDPKDIKVCENAKTSLMHLFTDLEDHPFTDTLETARNELLTMVIVANAQLQILQKTFAAQDPASLLIEEFESLAVMSERVSSGAHNMEDFINEAFKHTAPQ